MKRSYLTLLSLLLFTVFLSMVLGGESLDRESMTLEKSLSLEVKIEKEKYLYNQPIALSYLLYNRGEEISLTFPTSQIHEVELYRGEESLWYFSKDHLFLMVVTEKVLREGDYFLEVFTLPQEMVKSLTPGEYRIVVSIVSHPPIQAEVEFFIQ